MKFLRYAGDDYWWEWPDDGMTVFNFNGGHHTINENNPRFMEGTIIEAENWADLIRKTGYSPWHCERPTTDMWIAPDGIMYDCGTWGGHEDTALKIVRILLGEDMEYWHGGDRLIELGWIKVTTGPMHRHYVELGLYNNMTNAQWDTYIKWKERYGK